jgi:hypothetical protein
LLASSARRNKSVNIEISRCVSRQTNFNKELTTEGIHLIIPVGKNLNNQRSSKRDPSVILFDPKLNPLLPTVPASADGDVGGEVATQGELHDQANNWKNDNH